jgi:hypothetical protein
MVLSAPIIEERPPRVTFLLRWLAQVARLGLLC